MTSFQDRQKSLFNQLKEAEDQYSFSKTNKATAPQDYQSVDRQTYRKLKHEMKQFRGRESIFKRPEANIRECLRAKAVPDHLKNPQKYVYYSLADVTPEQMSDATNTATALALIRQLEEKEEGVNKMELDTDDSTVFKKPTFHISSAIRRKSEANDKVTFKSGKVIMPEYVVGVSKKKEKKTTLKKCQSQDSGTNKAKTELKLDHLFEEED